jgi:hypothetical protein
MDETGKSGTTNSENNENAPDGDREGYDVLLKPRRFKSSGNPKGRPKGSRNRKTIVRDVASELLTVTENGKRRRRTTLHVVLTLLRNKAFGGNIRAIDEVHRLSKVLEPKGSDRAAGVMIAPPEISVEEWIQEQEKLNETRLPPPGYDDYPDEDV